MTNTARLALACSVSLIALAVFWPAVGFEFVSYDDSTYVAQNDRVLGGLTSENVAWAFTTGYAANWHPLTWVSLMLDAGWNGADPFAFHLTSILLHAANAFLLFLLLERMTGAAGKSLMVAALFAVHPLHVEPVAWVSSRKDVLSTFFGLLCLLAWVGWTKHGSRGRYLLSLTAFCASLLAKQMLVTLPFLLLLLDVWPLRRVEWSDWRSGARALWRRVPEKLPFFLMALLAGVAVYLAQQSGGTIRDLEHFSPGSRVANAITVYVLYVWKTLWPANLAAYYPYPASIPAWQVIGSALALGATTFAAVACLRKRPYVAVGWFWYLGTLIPVIGLVQIGGQRMADRYSYVPLVGLFLAGTWLVGSVTDKGTLGKRVQWGVAFGLIVVLAVTARAQVRHWRDSLSLFGHAVTATPDNAVAHNNLGTEYGRAGQLDRALEHFREALRIDPEQADSYNNVGNAYRQLGRNEEARSHFLEALRIDPEMIAARMNLGEMLEQEGRIEEALEQYDRAVELQPESGRIRRFTAAAHERWGVELLRIGNQPAAIEEFREALRLLPESTSARERLQRALSGG